MCLHMYSMYLLVFLLLFCCNLSFFLQQCHKYFKEQQSYSQVPLTFFDKAGVITAEVIEHSDWVVAINKDHCQVRIHFYN